MITNINTFLDIRNYVQREKEEKKRERERKVEQLYLSYYLLITMLRKVEGVSATPSNLKI